MLTTATTVIERRRRIDGECATHPYEAGWALEAVFFIHAEDTHPELTIQPQISPDGFLWADRGPAVTLGPGQEVVAVDLHRFGGWLRLLVRGADPGHPAIVTVHLNMKG